MAFRMDGSGNGLFLFLLLVIVVIISHGLTLIITRNLGGTARVFVDTIGGGHVVGGGGWWGA